MDATIRKWTEGECAGAAGCWLDYGVRSCAEIYDDLQAMAAGMGWDGEVLDGEAEFANEAADKALGWLNDTCVPDGWHLVEDGERGGLFLERIEE